MSHEPLTKRIRRFAVVSLLAFSFGGFVFYAGVVIPIGSSVLDTTTQGFVTRRVTHVINMAVAVTTLALLWECWAGWRDRQLGANLVLLVCTLGIAAACAALAWLHPQLDGLLVEEEMDVTDVARFYAMHRIYLWLSTLQWLSSIPVTWIIINSRCGTNASQPPRNSNYA